MFFDVLKHVDLVLKASLVDSLDEITQQPSPKMIGGVWLVKHDRDIVA